MPRGHPADAHHLVFVFLQTHVSPRADDGRAPSVGDDDPATVLGGVSGHPLGIFGSSPSVHGQEDRFDALHAQGPYVLGHGPVHADEETDPSQRRVERLQLAARRDVGLAPHVDLAVFGQDLSFRIRHDQAVEQLLPRPLQEPENQIDSQLPGEPPSPHDVGPVRQALGHLHHPFPRRVRRGVADVAVQDGLGRHHHFRSPAGGLPDVRLETPVVVLQFPGLGVHGDDADLGIDDGSGPGLVGKRFDIGGRSRCGSTGLDDSRLGPGSRLLGAASEHGQRKQEEKRKPGA